MRRLDDDQVWWLFENVVTHCALVCYFGRGYFPPRVCFHLKMSRTLCAPEPVKRPTEGTAVSRRGLLHPSEGGFHCTEMCRAMRRFNQSNLWNPDFLLRVLACTRLWFCVLCVNRVWYNPVSAGLGQNYCDSWMGWLSLWNWFKCVTVSLLYT